MSATIEQIAAVSNLRACLLEIEDPPHVAALLAYFSRPFEIHRACATTTFPTNNDPIRRADWIDLDWPQQRLEAAKGKQGLQRYGSLMELRSVAIILDRVRHRRTEGDVARQVLYHPGNVADPLGEQEPHKLGSLFDQLEQIRAPRRVNLVVEHIGERRAKHEWPCPDGHSLTVPGYRFFPV